MTLAHIGNEHAFKPRKNAKGGSKKGKRHCRWPFVLKVIADAVVAQWKGSSEAWKRDRRNMRPHEFQERMDHVAPGWYQHMLQKYGPPPANGNTWAENLLNRVYKMYYSGTSDRGKDHDPETRACESGEHWSKKAAQTSPLGFLHDKVQKGGRALDWEKYLGDH